VNREGEEREGRKGREGAGRNRKGKRRGGRVTGRREGTEGGDRYVGKGESSTWIFIQGPRVPSYATACIVVREGPSQCHS